jgi:hypothetical protein
MKVANVRYWHEADLPARPFYGRLLGLSGH